MAKDCNKIKSKKCSIEKDCLEYTSCIVYDGDTFTCENDSTFEVPTGTKLNLLFSILFVRICTIVGDIININETITTIQTSITDILNSITEINNTITEIQGDITDIQNDITTVTNNIGEAMPLGSILQYSSTTPPNSKWLMCEGQTISRTTYADLFAIVGTTYGVGDGSSTFNLPDIRGKFLAGYNSGGATEYQTLGQGSGTNSVTLTGAQSGLRDHSHTASTSVSVSNAGAHIHQIGSSADSGSGALYRNGDNGSVTSNQNATESGGDHTHSATASTTINNSGFQDASEAHENRPEFIVLPFMIKVLT
jgi:microcystin-dependent protein